MKKIIDNAKQKALQNQIIWAYPIVLKLKEYNSTLSIQWAMECIQIYSFDLKSDKLSNLNKYIWRTTNLQNDLTSLQCAEISREIWYLPEREEIQTAISRLFGAMSAFKDGDEHGGIMETTMTVELLLPDISNHLLLDRYLKVAMKIYEAYKA
jgi:hypothetical protein